MATQGSTPALDAPSLCGSAIALCDRIKIVEKSGSETEGVFDDFLAPGEDDNDELEMIVRTDQGLLILFEASSIAHIERLEPGRGAGGPLAVYRYVSGEG